MPKEPTKNPGIMRFNARIEVSLATWGGDAGVPFPYNVNQLYGIADLVPVVATVEGHGFRSSIHRRGWFVTRRVLRIPKRVWRRLRKTPGDTVRVSVALDDEPRDVTVPSGLKVALSRRPVARHTFKKLPPLHQREYVYWINESGREATRKRRIVRAVEMLAEGKRLTSLPALGPGGNGPRFRIYREKTDERRNRDV
jgi:hypothetical protein